MKTLQTFLLTLFFVAPAFAQEQFGAGGPSPAARLDVNQGTAANIYIPPFALAGAFGTNVFYVDGQRGNDAWWGNIMSPVHSIAAALTNCQNSGGGTIVLVPGTTNYVNSTPIFNCTNITIIGYGSVIYVTNNSNGEIFDVWGGNFGAFGLTLFSTNVVQDYPILIHSVAGGATNRVWIQDCYFIAESDGVAMTGNFSSGKQWPFFEVLNCDFETQFDTFSIGTHGTNGVIANCRMVINAPTDPTAFGYGNVNVLHAISMGNGQVGETLWVENCNWYVNGGTNNLGLYNLSAGVVYLKNCSASMVPGSATTNNEAVYNAGAGFVSIEGGNLGGTILNVGTGAITNNGQITLLQTNNTPSNLVGPNGAFITTTNGTPYIRSNGVWHAMQIL